MCLATLLFLIHLSKATFICKKLFFFRSLYLSPLVSYKNIFHLISTHYYILHRDPTICVVFSLCFFHIRLFFLKSTPNKTDKKTYILSRLVASLPMPKQIMLNFIYATIADLVLKCSETNCVQCIWSKFSTHSRSYTVEMQTYGS